MKIHPKLKLGAILLFLLTLALLLIFLKATQSPQKSSLILNSSQNEFKLALNLEEKDKENFRSFIDNLVGQAYTESDLVFKLDATNTASLAFKTPIKATLNINPKRLELTGSLSQRISQSALNIGPIEIPNSAEFALLSSNLSSAMFGRLNLGEETRKLLEDTIKPHPGTYLTSFNSGHDFALYFKQDLNLNDIQSFPLEATVSSNTEGADQTKIYQMSFPSTNPEGKDVTPVLFEQHEYKVFTSSQEAADIILNAHSHKKFPTHEGQQDLALHFSPKDNFNSATFAEFIEKDGLKNQEFKDKFQKALPKIKDLSLSLKGTSFSGLIILK